MMAYVSDGYMQHSSYDTCYHVASLDYDDQIYNLSKETVFSSFNAEIIML